MNDIVERLKAYANDWRERAKSTVAIGDAIEEIKLLRSKLDTANALVTCCCGNPVDTHGMGDGHSPVDMYHYRLMRVEEQNDKLQALVRVLLDNNPDELISDASHSVLDLWRHNARELLGVK